MTGTDGLERVSEHRHAPSHFYRERDPIPTVKGTGWAPGSVRTHMENKFPVHTGFKHRTVQL